MAVQSMDLIFSVSGDMWARHALAKVGWRLPTIFFRCSSCRERVKMVS